MRYGRYAWPYIIMRVSLGAVFLWIGIDVLRNPETWIGYVPQNVPLGLERDFALRLNGVFDVIIGLLLIADNMTKIASLLAAVHLAAILALQGINAVLIRDVGLLGTALALFFWPQHRRKHVLQKYVPFLKKRSHGGGEEE